MNAPAFQFYAADYLADENVSVMTLEEEGAYWRAICYCWREGSIPADDGRLSRLLKGASNQTLRVVRHCFNQMATDPTRLVHPRLEIEREKQRLWREKSAAAGRKSGKVRRIKKFSTEPTFVNGLNQMATKPEPNTNSSSSSSSSSSSKDLKTNTKTLAESDKKPVAPPLEATVFDLPCTSGQTYRLPESLYTSMVKAYPGISVMSELEKARVWLLANRTQMKTVTGVPRFLNSWMSRAQNNCKPNGASNGHYQTESKYQRAEREALEILAREEADAIEHGPASKRIWGDA